MSDKSKRFRRAVSRAWGSRTAAVSAVVVVGLAFLVLIAGVVFAVAAPAHRSSERAAGAPRPTSAATPTSRPHGAAHRGGCAVPVTDHAAKPAAPTDLQWRAGNGGVSWPESATAGPTQFTSGFGACFEHAPVGAAMAATNGFFSQWSAPGAAAAYEFYIADGPGKKASVDAIRKGPDSTEMMRDLGISAAGFQLNAYTTERAQVTVVMRAPQSQTGYIGAPLTVVWTGDDWRIQVLDDGNWFAGTGNQITVGSFTPWSAS